jgi:hypothetical protein
VLLEEAAVEALFVAGLLLPLSKPSRCTSSDRMSLSQLALPHAEIRERKAEGFSAVLHRLVQSDVESTMSTDAPNPANI